MDEVLERMILHVRVMRDRRLLVPVLDEHTLSVESLCRSWVDMLLERAHAETEPDAPFGEGCECEACTVAAANSTEKEFIDSGDAHLLGILMREAETTKPHETDDKPNVYGWAAERDARSRMFDLLAKVPCRCDCCDQIGGYGCSCARCIAAQHNSEELQLMGVYRELGITLNLRFPPRSTHLSSQEDPGG